MNFLDMVPGWREALLGAVAILVLYMAFVFMRLRRMRKPAQAAPAAEPAPAPVPDQPAVADATLPGELAVAAYTEKFPWNEAPDGPSGEVRLAALEQELNRLRSEITTLRGEMASVSGELSTLRADLRHELDRVDERVEAAQHVAPIYGEAMHMALAGHDAASIAERCGVARAEAELVVALIRNREEGDAAEDNELMRER